MQVGAARYYYLFDSLGSVIGLTDASGNLVESYRYNAYGQPLQASTIGNPYMFTGRRFDSETGLYYYRNRYYSPQLRRFIEPDPIGFEGGMNLYAYVGNDPGNAVDPWGLFDSVMTPYAVAAAPFIAMADSPFLPFGDALAGALIGLAYLHDTWPEKGSCTITMSKVNDDDKVKDILRYRKGSIKQAQLPEGSPSWDEIQDMTFRDITKNAQKNLNGFKTIRKLLNDSRFYK